MTLTTVGFSEVHQLSQGGRVFTMVFLVVGLGVFMFGAVSLGEELQQRRLPFVVIESAPEVAEACKEKGWSCVIGDATADEVLQEAGIERARGVACTLPSDAEKLKRAGANKVISLYATGAVKMAQLMATPNVEDFFEVVTGKGKSFDLAEVKVAEGVAWAGRTLAKSGLREQGVMVVGIRRPNGDLLMPPGPNDELRVGDCPIALGKIEAIQALLH